MGALGARRLLAGSSQQGSHVDAISMCSEPRRGHGAMRFSVLTYNVLHSVGAERLRKLPAAPRWPANRLARCAEVIERLKPDVACVQDAIELYVKLYKAFN